jgi:C1A family cysteine protease
MRRVATVVFVAFACAIVATASLTTVDADASLAAFEAFASRFGKSYESETARAAAYGHFVASVKQMHDMRARNPHAAFELNARSDLPPRKTSYKPPKATLPVKPMPSVEFPLVMDWRKENVLPPVADMGQCGGGCVSFTFTGMGTAINQIKHYTSEPVALSSQQLLECSPQECGCNGCMPHEVFEALKDNNGNWDTAASYPYVAQHGGPMGTCQDHASEVVVGGKVTELRQIEKRSTTALATAVLQSPVATENFAQNWETYTGGVLTDCGEGQNDNMALLVGYNDEAPVPYWIVRNQWGADWGMGGYMYIAKGNNTCGLLDGPMVIDMEPFA